MTGWTEYQFPIGYLMPKFDSFVKNIVFQVM